MKSISLALVMTIALLVSCDLSAEARPASSHSGTASGYKGGFSSQKGNNARAAPMPPARSNSALSRDMERNAAQANALKTLDARRAAAAPPPPPVAPPVVAPVPVHNPPVYTQAPQPVIVPQPNNGFMYGVMGFMLGRAMSQPQPVSVPHNRHTEWDSNTAPAASPAMAQTPAPAAAPASFGLSVLRGLMWLALVSGLLWLALYTVRKLRRLRSTTTTHYSFERN
ncbi:MAG: hypothetical protein ACEQSK_01640 [Sphingomonadaceae bacterium]